MERPTESPRHSSTNTMVQLMAVHMSGLNGLPFPAYPLPAEELKI